MRPEFVKSEKDQQSNKNNNNNNNNNNDQSSSNNAGAHLTSFLRVTPLPTEKGHDSGFFVDKNRLHVAGTAKDGGISMAFAAPGARVDRLRRTLSNALRRKGSMRKLSDAASLVPLSPEQRALNGDLRIQYRGAFDEKAIDDNVALSIAQAVAPVVAQRRNVTLVFSGPAGSGKSNLSKLVIPAILQHLGLKATLLLAEENHSEQLVFGTLKPMAERVKLTKNQHKHGFLLQSEVALVEARQNKNREIAETATAETNAQLSGTANKQAKSKMNGGNNNNNNNNNKDGGDGDDDMNNENASTTFSPGSLRHHAATPQPGKPPRGQKDPDHRYELLVYAPPPRNRVLVLPDGVAGMPAGSVNPPRSMTPSSSHHQKNARSGSNSSYNNNNNASPTRSVFSIAKLRGPWVESSPQRLIPKLVDDDEEDEHEKKKRLEEEEAAKQKDDDGDNSKGINHPMFDRLREVRPTVTEPDSIFHLKKNGRDSIMQPSFRMPATGPLNLPNNRLVDFALGDTEGGLGFFVWLKDSGRCTEPAILFDSIDTVDRAYNVRISLHSAEGDKFEPGALCVSIRDFHSKKLEVVFQEVCHDTEWHSYTIHIQPPVNLITVSVDGLPTRKRVVAAENPMTFFPERLKVTKVGAISTKPPDGGNEVISSLFVDGCMYLYTLFESKTAKLIQQFKMTPDAVVIPEEVQNNNKNNSNAAGGAGSAFRNNNNKKQNENNNASSSPAPIAAPLRDPNLDKTQFRDTCGGEPMTCPQSATFDEIAFVDSYPVFNGYSTFVNAGTLGNFGLYLPTCGVDVTFKTSVSNDQMCAIGLTDITGKHTGFGLEFNTGVNMQYQRYSICFWIRDYDGNTSRCALDASQVFDDRWHTFTVRVLQLENAKFKIKIDGRTHETSASIPGAATSKVLVFQSPCAIGAHYERGRRPVRFFNGAIRQVSLWQCIIESKVDTQMAIWKLDDGPGSRIAVDASGYLNHGVYQIWDSSKEDKGLVNKKLGMISKAAGNNNNNNPGGAAAGAKVGNNNNNNNNQGGPNEIFRKQLAGMPPVGFFWPRYQPPAGDDAEAALRAATGGGGGGGGGGDGSGTGGGSNVPRKSFANNILKAACVAITTLVTETGNAKEVVIDLFKEHAGSDHGPAFEAPDDFPYELLREWDESGRTKDDRRVVRPLPNSFFTKITTTNYLNLCREALHRFEAYSENAHMVFQLYIGDSVFTVVDLLGLKRSHLAVFNPVQLVWRDVISTVGDVAKQRTVLSRSTQAAEKALLDMGSKPQLFKRGMAAIPSTRMPTGDIVADIITHALIKGSEPSTLFLTQVIATNSNDDNVRYTALWAERILKTDRTNAAIVLQKAFRAILARRRFKRLDTFRRQRLAREYHNTMTRKQCPRECDHRKKKIALLCFAGSFDIHEVNVQSGTGHPASSFNCSAEVPPLNFGRDPTELVTTLEDLGYTVTVFNEPRKESIINFIRELQPKMACYEIQLLVYVCGYYVSNPANIKELHPTATSMLQALGDEQNFERKQLIRDFKIETVNLYKEFVKGVHDVQDIVKIRIADQNKKIAAIAKKKKMAVKAQALRDELNNMEAGIKIQLYSIPTRVLLASTSMSTCEEKNELHLFKMTDRAKHDEYDKNRLFKSFHMKQQNTSSNHHLQKTKSALGSRRNSIAGGGGGGGHAALVSFARTDSKVGGAAGGSDHGNNKRKHVILPGDVPFLDDDDAGIEILESCDGSDADSDEDRLHNDENPFSKKEVQLKPHPIESVQLVLGQTSATEVGEYLSLRELEQMICGSMPRRGQHGICCYDLIPFVHTNSKTDLPRSGFTVSSGENIRIVHPHVKYARWFSYYFIRGIRGSAVESMRQGKRPVAEHVDVEAMTKYLEQHCTKYPQSARVESIKYWGEYVGDIFFAPLLLHTKEMRQKVHTQNKQALAVIKISLHDPEETFMQTVASELARLAKLAPGKHITVKRSAFAPELQLFCHAINLRSLLEHPFALEHLGAKYTSDAKKFITPGVSPKSAFSLDLLGPEAVLRLRLRNVKTDKHDLSSQLAPGVFTQPSSLNIGGIADPKERCYAYTNLAEDVRCRVEETIIPFWRHFRDEKLDDDKTHRAMEDSSSMHYANKSVTNNTNNMFGRAGRMSFAGVLPTTNSNQVSRRGSVAAAGALAVSLLSLAHNHHHSGPLAPVSPLPHGQFFSKAKMDLYLVAELGETDARNLDRASRISPEIGKIGTLVSCVVVNDKLIREVDEHEAFFHQLDQFKSAEARARAAREAEARKKLVEKYEALLKQAADNTENQGRAVATSKISGGQNDIRLWFALPLQDSVLSSINWTIKTVFGARNGSVIRALVENGFMSAIQQIAEGSPLVIAGETDPRGSDGEKSNTNNNNTTSNNNVAVIQTYNMDGTINLNAKPAAVRVALVKLAAACISLPPLSSFVPHFSGTPSPQTEESGLASIINAIVIPSFTAAFTKGPRLDKEEFRSVAQISNSLLTTRDNNCKDISLDRSPSTEQLIQLVARWSSVLLFDASRQTLENTEGILNDRHHAFQSINPPAGVLLGLVACCVKRLVDEFPLGDEYSQLLGDAAAADAKEKELQYQQLQQAAAREQEGASPAEPFGAFDDDSGAGSLNNTLTLSTAKVLFKASDAYDETVEPPQSKLAQCVPPLLQALVSDIQIDLPEIKDPRTLLYIFQLWSCLQVLKQKFLSYYIPGGAEANNGIEGAQVVLDEFGNALSLRQQNNSSGSGAAAATADGNQQQQPPPPKLPQNDFITSLKTMGAQNIQNLAQKLILAKPVRDLYVRLKKDPLQMNNNESILHQCKNILRKLPDAIRGGLSIAASEYTVSSINDL